MLNVAASFAVAERIRQDPGLAGVTVMLLTYVMSGDLARCRQLGVAPHLVKPLSRPSYSTRCCWPGHPEPTTASAPAARGTASRRLQVLVVEDNAVNQVLITRLLEKMGHVCVIANNGQEAVQAHQTCAFDVVLMDVQMPLMDGLAATAAIRSARPVSPVAAGCRSWRSRRSPCAAIVSGASQPGWTTT